MTTDTLFYFRKMRNYAYANQKTAAYLSFNLLDATSQLYAYQLLESLLNTTPQKLMFWKLGTRKLVLAEITSTQEELKNLFPHIPLASESETKPEMITWERTFGGSWDDRATDIIQTTEGGYAVAGYTLSKVAGEKDKDAWVVKLDNQGNLLWDNTFGGSDWDEANSIIQTTDGDYLVAGGTASKGVGEFDVWIVKLNSQGNIIWDKTFGGSDDDTANSIIQTTDGGYAIAGYRGKGAGRDDDAWIIKLDEKGNLLWDKTFGGSGDYNPMSIVQTKDGSYVIAGIPFSSNPRGVGFWIIKLDEEGNLGKNSLEKEVISEEAIVITSVVEDFIKALNNLDLDKAKKYCLTGSEVDKMLDESKNRLDRFEEDPNEYIQSDTEFKTELIINDIDIDGTKAKVSGKSKVIEIEKGEIIQEKTSNGNILLEKINNQWKIYDLK